MQEICIIEWVMKRERQKKILELISGQRIATQQELVERLLEMNFEATQSSVSRDIFELGLTKINGFYVAPDVAWGLSQSLIELATAGENLIVLKTSIGQAQPVALRIDG